MVNFRLTRAQRAATHNPTPAPESNGSNQGGPDSTNTSNPSTRPLAFAALALVVLLLRLEVRTVVSLSPSSSSTAAPLSVGFVGPLRFVFVFEVVPANWLTRSSI